MWDTAVELGPTFGGLGFLVVCPGGVGVQLGGVWFHADGEAVCATEHAGGGGGVGPCVGAVGLALGGGVPCPGLGEGVLFVGFDDGPVGGEPAEDVAVGDPFGGGELLVFVAADGSVEVADDELFEFGSDVAGGRGVQHRVVGHDTRLEPGGDKVSTVPGRGLERYLWRCFRAQNSTPRQKWVQELLLPRGEFRYPPSMTARKTSGASDSVYLRPLPLETSRLRTPLGSGKRPVSLPRCLAGTFHVRTTLDSASGKRSIHASISATAKT